MLILYLLHFVYQDSHNGINEVIPQTFGLISTSKMKFLKNVPFVFFFLFFLIFRISRTTRVFFQVRHYQALFMSLRNLLF